MKSQITRLRTNENAGLMSRRILLCSFSPSTHTRERPISLSTRGRKTAEWAEGRRFETDSSIWHGTHGSCKYSVKYAQDRLDPPESADNFVRDGSGSLE